MLPRWRFALSLAKMDYDKPEVSITGPRMCRPLLHGRCASSRGGRAQACENVARNIKGGICGGSPVGHGYVQRSLRVLHAMHWRKRGQAAREALSSVMKFPRSLSDLGMAACLGYLLES